MKILLLGKNGQVGWELQRALAPLGQIIALDSSQANFAQPEQVLEHVRAAQARVIVNAAAHTAVDKAESEPDLARQINALTPGLIAAEAAKQGALFVHYSTDYVFDGKGDEPRNELSPTGPLGVYGRTKLADQVAEEVRRYFGDKVLRTVIPRSVKVSEAPGYSMTIIDYDPGSRGALSYLDASREIAERGAARGGKGHA